MKSISSTLRRIINDPSQGEVRNDPTVGGIHFLMKKSSPATSATPVGIVES